MNPQKSQQRRSSEVRGCLLRNFLDMRKRSLIRSESEDSGFSLEPYEPHMSSSFDAEKFLEELGFARDKTPLIPDRFIPSLIHRISSMHDETVLKLDTRVWNSIDSFKKKERSLWFFSQSGMECDLCINDLQRSYSVPAEFEQDTCDSLYPGISATGNRSSSALKVQNWLSRFTVVGNAKASITDIGNQSSTESGILSALSDDEAYTTANYMDGSDSCCPYKRVGDMDFPTPKEEYLKPTAALGLKRKRTPEAIPTEARDTETINVSLALCLEAPPQRNYEPLASVSLIDISTSEISPVQKEERYEYSDNGNSSLNRQDTTGGSGHCRPVHETVNEIPTAFVSGNGNLKQNDFNDVQACGQLANLDTKNVFLSTENSDCHVNGDAGYSPKDDNITHSVAPSKNSDVTNFDGFKKRHSFDSAYLTAAEKRKRFRLSHSKTHNFLFEKEDICLATGNLNAMAAGGTTPYDSTILRNPHEETEVKHSDQLKSQKGDDSSQDIPYRNGASLDTPSEVSDIVSNVDVPHSNEDNLYTTISEVPDVVSNSGSNMDTPVNVFDIVSDVDISHHDGGNLDTSLEVTDIDNNVDISHHDGGNLDTSLEVSDSDNNLNMSHHDSGNLATLQVPNIVRNIDISHRNGGNLDTSVGVSEIVRKVDILSHNAGNLETLVVSGIVSNVGKSKVFEVPSDSESSEQYFSCDELFTKKIASNNGSTDHGGGEEKKEIPFEPANLVPCLPAEQRVSTTKVTSSQMLSRDKILFRNYNRSTYAKYKEHFILNKILKRGLKFSVLCPIEKMSRHFLLENDRTDNETFSQILNSPPSSLKCKDLEKRTKPVTYGESPSLLNFGRRKKCMGSTLRDKAAELDNNQSIIHKPFVRNLSPSSSDMASPKCDVRLIKYDGLALFWAARNALDGSISNDSGFHDSMNSNSDNTTNRSLVNGVYMDVNSGSETDRTNNKLYISEVRLEVNHEERQKHPEKARLKGCGEAGKLQLEDPKEEVQDENFSISKKPTNTENPCGRALRDLEDLRAAIQKAKETRMSASRELRLLQELLHSGDTGDESRRTTLGMSELKLSLPDAEIMSGNNGKGKKVEALSELQQTSAKETSQNKEFWEEKIRKAKEEISQVCHEKLSIMEEKLRTTEDELARALKENTRLKDQLELRSAAFPLCKCNAEAQQHSNFSHMNGTLDEDPKVNSAVKPSLPTKNFWQEWDRLQSDLMKAERKADELNILLNQKLIELNRMQLTLSKQTKEMILLEKAYFQLRSHLSKRKLHKSGSSHPSAVKTLTSTERASETSSKTTDPEIPP